MRITINNYADAELFIVASIINDIDMEQLNKFKHYSFISSPYIKQKFQIYVWKSPKGIALDIHDQAKKTCDVCGSTDLTEVPHMGFNCNTCHPL